MSRILHIDTGREMRGGQWQALHLVAGLRCRGMGPRLLARKSSPLLEAAQARGLDVRPLVLGRLPFEAGNFDLVHAHDARAHSLALLMGRPVVVSRRVAFPVKRSLPSRVKYRGAAAYLAVSRFVRNQLIAAGVDGRKIEVVYDGVEIPAGAADEDRDLVLALDSSDPAKGRAVIEQASSLAGVPVHFSTSLARDLPLARLFLYITDSEGLGSAALMAMAHRVPVIASRVGGLPEIVSDGETGVLTSNQPEKVAAELRRLLDQPDRLRRMGQRGLERVLERFTVDRMVSDTAAVYERLLS